MLKLILQDNFPILLISAKLTSTLTVVFSMYKFIYVIHIYSYILLDYSLILIY